MDFLYCPLLLLHVLPSQSPAESLKWPRGSRLPCDSNNVVNHSLQRNGAAAQASAYDCVAQNVKFNVPKKGKKSDIPNPIGARNATAF